MTADQMPGGPEAGPVLTARQRKIVRFISDWVQERGYSPSMREIGRAVGLTSTSSVEHQLAALEVLVRPTARPISRMEGEYPRFCTQSLM